MNRYKIIIEYLGTNFHGWQRQKNKISIQEILENALRKLLQENIRTTVSGRTDAGVHAKAQVVHFDTNKIMTLDRMLLGINYYLLKEKNGDKVSVKKITKVNFDFNARFSAKEKIYNYYIVNDVSRDTFMYSRSWWVRKRLDVENMKYAASFLVGKHDFTSFRAKGCQASSPIKTINNIELLKKKNIIKISFAARSFLYNQVRIMTGTLKDIGTGALKPKDLQKILRKKDRRYAGVTAPSKGLILFKITYK